MSTRSNIAILNEDKSVDVIYCHWDGYVEHNGKILQDYYTNTDVIRDLIDLGDLSSLGYTILHNPDDWKSFEHNGARCLTYKDRGETNVDARHYDSVRQWLDILIGSDIEYAYWWDGEKWFYSTSKTLFRNHLLLRERV